MKLTLKTTLLWFSLVCASLLLVALIFAICWLLLAYPEFITSILMGVFIIYVLIQLWVSIYNYLKNKGVNNG